MIFEICAESFEAVQLAQKYKVKRVELCSALSLGGLTPGIGLIEQCVSVKEVEVHVMIRHKEGCFVYDAHDIEIMCKDILASAKAGVAGVVFGCLTEANEVNIQQNKLLAGLAKQFGLEVTFHRAFDFCDDPLNALEQLIGIGFTRILTSGQEAKAEEGIKLISQLVEQANGRIQIMAGSGVNATNALNISKAGVNALHFSAHKKNNTPMELGMGSPTVTDEYKVKSIVELF